MTRRMQNHASCYKCGQKDIECPVCGEFIETSTPFSLWMRDHGPHSTRDSLDVENLDYVLYKYRDGDLSLAEEKRYGSRPTSAQSDTLKIIHQLLRHGADSGKLIKTLRGLRTVKYHGVHLIRFENTTPDDGWIELDNNRVSREELIRFLNFGKDLQKPYKMVE